MALKLTFTDSYENDIIDSYWRIEKVIVDYYPNPVDGQPESIGKIFLKGYPNENWRSEGKPPFRNKHTVRVNNVQDLPFGDYDSLRSICYAKCKEDPFFATATDIIKD